MKKNIFKCLLALVCIMPLSLNAQTTTSKTTTKKATTTKSTAKKATPKKEAATPPANATVGAMPVMKFNAKSTDLGKVKTGDMPAYTYEFTNTGTAPLDIEICSGCECTEIDWSKGTIKPGEKGFIKAVYNTKKAEPEDHKKPLTKYIDIVLKQTHPKSGYPIVESVKFDVFIVD